MGQSKGKPPDCPVRAGRRAAGRDWVAGNWPPANHNKAMPLRVARWELADKPARVGRCKRVDRRVARD